MLDREQIEGFRETLVFNTGTLADCKDAAVQAIRDAEARGKVLLGFHFRNVAGQPTVEVWLTEGEA